MSYKSTYTRELLLNWNVFGRNSIGKLAGIDSIPNTVPKRKPDNVWVITFLQKNARDLLHNEANGIITGCTNKVLEDIENAGWKVIGEKDQSSPA